MNYTPRYLKTGENIGSYTIVVHQLKVRAQWEAQQIQAF